ncbi:type IV secretory system conjugative DNA transfer family protein [Marinomonas sp. 2405UD68-3]|uniref:type IV secretory system conjugative DNA transfer family protein n=1 Tax=Marinomonas sp. 2405UD68-3 TaxID=3391835 RepID=UPI0039C8D64B
MITVMLVTGCANSPMEHLELQAKPTLSSMCENSEPDFSDLNFAKTIDNYYNPKKFFQENKKLSSDDVREIENIYEEAWNLGRKVGEFDTEATFWNSVLNPAASQLDIIYNYRSIMYDSLVLPKRLSIIEGGVEKDGSLLYDRGYTVVIDDDFVALTSEPSWRDFFHLPNKDVPVESVYSFDLTSSNMKAWKDGINDGYFEGVCLTLIDYQQSVLNLSSDFTQRYLYVVSERRGLTKKPDIKSVKMPVNISGRQIDLDLTTYKINDEGDFEDRRKWGKFK